MGGREVGYSQKTDEPGGNPVGGQPYFGFVCGIVGFAIPDCISCSDAFSECVQRLLGVCGHRERSVETFRHSPYQGRGILAFFLELIWRKYSQGKNAEQQGSRDQPDRRQEKPKPSEEAFST